MKGGDLGSAIAVARSATVWAPTEPAVWVFLAECLVRSAGSVVSVLERATFSLKRGRRCNVPSNWSRSILQPIWRSDAFS